MAWAEPALSEMGRAAAHELQDWGDACEREPARLRTFDGWGNRVDEVVYPDAWRQLAAVAARSEEISFSSPRRARSTDSAAGARAAAEMSVAATSIVAMG